MRGSWSWRGVLAGALVVLGVACFAQAGVLHAKAWLGQRLIANSWDRMQADGGIVRPWSWADLHPVARLRVPSHEVDLLVLAGATGQSLAWGPGHLSGSAPPGSPGHVVVGGHRDTHFAFLRRVETGVEIQIEDARGRRMVYRVTQTFITDARDGSVLAPSNVPQLTLVTCWPFDTPVPGGPQRFVVVAEAFPSF